MNSNTHLPVSIIDAKDPKAAYFSLLQEMKEYYHFHMQDILKLGREQPKKTYGAYNFDLQRCLNEVELIAWDATRTIGNLPFYPQFPVGKYFLDFANPTQKIGIEIDGKEFHNYDDDAEKDAGLRQIGWKIIRITASDMVRVPKVISYDPEMKKETEEWITGTGDGVLFAIKVLYFGGDPYVPEDDIDWFMRLCRFSIDLRMKKF